jgi:2-hydroxy-3-keto-5-methylthiopentenyl-1-phosphate phosphatase
MRTPKIVAVDFDGTLTLTDDYPYALNPNCKAFQTLLKFKHHGGKVILWTCRMGKPLETAVTFCKALGLTFDAVNENIPEQIQKWLESNPTATISPKVYADVYIDDRGNTGEIDWRKIDVLLNGKREY